MEKLGRLSEQTREGEDGDRSASVGTSNGEAVWWTTNCCWSSYLAPALAWPAPGCADWDEYAVHRSLDNVRELNDLYKESRVVQEIIDQALKLEGAVRSTGVHAAGVIVANGPLEKFVPLQLREPQDPSKGRTNHMDRRD